jgi:hypothetical protein
MLPVVNGGSVDRGSLLVEALGEETLVYDPATNEAHCLDPLAAAEFRAAGDDISRREVIRRLALAGAATAAAAPLVRTIVAPTPAHAVSGCACGVGAGTTVCPAGQGCLAAVTCVSCVGSGSACTVGTFTCCTTCTATICPNTGIC